MRKTLYLAMGISIFFTLVACSLTPSSNTPQLKTVRLIEVTHSLFYAPQYVAMEKGFFNEEGLDISLTNGNGGDKTMAAILADQADVALVGAEAGIYVTSRGSTQVITAFAQLTQTDGSFLVSRQPIPTFTWDQLKGKTLLGQRRGGMPEMVSEYVQRIHGITPHKDVKILQNVDLKNLSSAFISGTGDFVQLFEPVASMLEQNQKGVIVASFGEGSGRLPYTCYLAKRSFLDQDRDTAKRFTRAIIKGQQWVKTHSADQIAQAIKSHFPETDYPILVRAIQRYKEQKSYAENPLIQPEQYKHLLRIMKQAGELPKELSYKDYVDTKIVQEAMGR